MSELDPMRAAMLKILWIAPYDSQIYLLAQDALNRIPTNTVEDPTPHKETERSSDGR